MSFSRVMMIFMALLLTTVLPLQAGPPKGNPVEPLKQWSGSVDDLPLREAVPEVILSKKGFENLWHVWKVPGSVPEVDFSRNLVVVQTTQGSKLRLAITLDENGNLQVLGLATRDLRPGFRYLAALLSRNGVKTLNGKELIDTTEKASPKTR
jgi:hypothetical protein